MSDLSLLGRAIVFSGKRAARLTCPVCTVCRCRAGCVNRLSGTNVVGHLCQTPGRFTEPSRGLQAT
jgi:hypothetical protein